MHELPIFKKRCRAFMQRFVSIAVLVVLSACATSPMDSIVNNDADGMRSQLDGLASNQVTFYMTQAMIYQRWNMVDLMRQRGGDFKKAADALFTDLNPNYDEATVIAIVDALLSRGLDPNQKFANGTRPLNALCAYPGAAQKLMARGAVVDVKSTKSVVLSCLQTMELAVNSREVAPNPKVWDKALDNAAKTAILFIQNGADTNSRYGARNGLSTPLLLKAVVYAPQTVVDALIAHGANVLDMQDGGYAPLYAAVEKQDAKQVSYLLGKGKLAVQSQKPKNWKIDYLAWINHQEKHGWTPLHVAASMGNREIMQLFLDEGADLSLKTEHGYTAQDLFKIKLAQDESARQQRIANEQAAKRQQQENAERAAENKQALWTFIGLTAANYQANKAAQAAQSAQAANFYANSQRAADQQKADVDRRNAQMAQQLTPKTQPARAGSGQSYSAQTTANSAGSSNQSITSVKLAQNTAPKSTSSTDSKVSSNSSATKITDLQSSMQEAGNLPTSSRAYQCMTRVHFDQGLKEWSATSRLSDPVFLTVEQACAKARKKASDFAAAIDRGEVRGYPRGKVKSIDACALIPKDDSRVGLYVHIEEPSSSPCDAPTSSVAK